MKTNELVAIIAGIIDSKTHDKHGEPINEISNSVERARNIVRETARQSIETGDVVDAEAFTEAT